MTETAPKTYSYRFRAVRACLPPVEAWAPHLRDSYDIGWFANNGPAAQKLERALAARWGGADSACVLAANATAGLSAALIAHRIEGPVICPAFTFPATHSAIMAARAETVLVDVDPLSWMMTPQTLDDALRRTGARAAMLVTPYGLRYDLSEHIEICRRHGALLVIDNAAGLGVARTAHETAPHVIEVFSLHATKPFAIGEGGAIFVHTSRVDALRSAMNFAITTRDDADGPYWGFNGKCSDFAAAIGLAMLERIDGMVAFRQTLARRHMDLVGDFDGVDHVRDPSRATWQVFPAVMPTAESATALISAAAEREVEIRRYYRPCLSIWPRIRMLDACPVSRALADRACCLPIYGEISEADFAEMSARLREAFEIALGRAAAPVRAGAVA